MAGTDASGIHSEADMPKHRKNHTALMGGKGALKHRQLRSKSPYKVVLRDGIYTASLPIPQKLVSVIYSLRPAQGEQGIVNALNVKENIVMHEKVNRRIVEEAVPLLTEFVKEGISQGMLSCNNIEERVKMLLIISQHTFDDGDFSDRDVEVYIDMVEKTFGAEAGTMNFIRELISGGQRSE